MLSVRQRISENTPSLPPWPLVELDLSSWTCGVSESGYEFIVLFAIVFEGWHGFKVGLCHCDGVAEKTDAGKAWSPSLESLCSSRREVAGDSTSLEEKGDGNCWQMFRMPLISSSEPSDWSLRWLEVGIRRGEARLDSVLLALDRTLMEDRKEAAVSADARLGVRDGRHSLHLALGLRIRGEQSGLGGSGMSGGGPSGCDEACTGRAVTARSLQLTCSDIRCEAILVRALEARREGAGEELSVAEVVCKLCESTSSSSAMQLICELDSCELIYVSSDANEERGCICLGVREGRLFGGTGKA